MNEPRYHLAAGNHLLLGEGYALVGQIVHGHGRLTARLHAAGSGNLEVAGVRLHLPGEEAREIERLHLGATSVWAAHEMIDLAGEAHYQRQADPEDAVRVRAHFQDPSRSPLRGAIKRSDLHGARPFAVLHGPQVVDADPARRDPWFPDLWRGLPWLALSRERIAFFAPEDGES